MTPLQSREPGVVGAALSHPHAYAELILDQHHVHPAAFLSALYAKGDRLLLVSDAMRASGLHEGESELGGQRVWVADGKATLADGTLAGSVLTIDVAFRNALELGVTVGGASALCSSTPARYLGLSDRGSLTPGKRADILVMNREGYIQDVYIAGRAISR